MFYSNSSYTPAYTRSTEFGVKHVYRFMSELPVLKSCRIERFCHISIILCKNDSSRFGKLFPRAGTNYSRTLWLWRDCEGRKIGRTASFCFNIWCHMYPITFEVAIDYSLNTHTHACTHTHMIEIVRTIW